MLIWSQHPSSHVASQLQPTCHYSALSGFLHDQLVQDKLLSVKGVGRSLQGHDAGTASPLGPRGIPPCSSSTAAEGLREVQQYSLIIL